MAFRTFTVHTKQNNNNNKKKTERYGLHLTFAWTDVVFSLCFFFKFYLTKMTPAVFLFDSRTESEQTKNKKKMSPELKVV